MKLAAYLLVALLFSACVAAQDSAKPAPPKQQSPATTTDEMRFSVEDEEQASTARENNTCYTIRAYFFERSADPAPEPVGMATCVPSSQRALKRAQKKPVKTIAPIFVTN